MTNKERMELNTHYAKSLLENYADKIFVDLQTLYDIPSGDISVDLAIRLENAIDKLAEVIALTIEYQKED